MADLKSSEIANYHPILESIQSLVINLKSHDMVGDSGRIEGEKKRAT